MIAPASEMARRPTPDDCARLRTTERVLVLIGLLSPLRRGATVNDLMRDLADCGHAVCDRTIERDLQMLNRLRLADRIDRGLWQWRGADRRADALANAGQELAAG